MQLHWLPEPPNWRLDFRALMARDGDIWPDAVRLANARLDFTRTNALDELVRKRGNGAVPQTGTKPVRLAILGSSTMAHLHAGIRVAALRRNIAVSTYENEYGQYLQELHDRGSGLHAFQPDTVLFAFDARHLAQGLAGTAAADAERALAEALDRLRQCWRLAREAFGASVLQQTVLDVFPALLGNNEHRLPASKSAFVARLNTAIREAAEAEGIDLLDVAAAARRDGMATWHDPALWHRSKQEISPAQSPSYGDLVGRLMAARQGRSYKCLVLDLDNTLWGGVVGDDGLEGIVIGQGSALGEGFVAVQEYARDLARRGVILAVSSKNDEANALEPFDKHPEMVLRRGDIASFRADWNDKAANIRAIAAELNIGLDSLVFLDDNPFERNLVRQELPMVAVPEVPDDPALVPQVLADAGYFESLRITEEDRERTGQYQENRAREALRASATDMAGYLRGLEMRMVWRRFDELGRQRIVQLINKTNQFNLTTRRHADPDVGRMMADPDWFGLQIRLTDRFGDNGIIAIVIGCRTAPEEVMIDTWLMSCRVLGRQVEATTLNLVAEAATAMGAKRLLGEYLPTKKNGMVRDHYEKLGFAVIAREPDGASRAVLDLTSFSPAPTFIEVVEG